jgi:hypothetical protein
MTKEELVHKIVELLRTDVDLSFLLTLRKEQLETVVACIRNRIDYGGEEEVSRR